MKKKIKWKANSAKRTLRRWIVVAWIIVVTITYYVNFAGAFYRENRQDILQAFKIVCKLW